MSSISWQLAHSSNFLISHCLLCAYIPSSTAADVSLAYEVPLCQPTSGLFLTTWSSIYATPWGPNSSFFSGALQHYYSEISEVYANISHNRGWMLKSRAFFASTEPVLHKHWVSEWILILHHVNHSVRITICPVYYFSFKEKALKDSCHKINGSRFWNIGIKNVFL